MTTFLTSLPKGFGEAVLSCRLRSIHEVVEVALMLQKDFWVFRGHYNATWPLQTSLERATKDHTDWVIVFRSEERAISDFRNLTRLLLPQVERRIDSLAAMQHYGVPTRLLDFSRSFFIALFFAYEKGKNKQSDQHALWAINMDKALRQSAVINDWIDKEIDCGLNALPTDDPVECHATESAIREGSFDFLHIDTAARMSRILELAEELLRREPSGIRPGVLPIDIPGTNSRMQAQNGLFLMGTDFRPFEVNLVEAFGIKTGFGNPVDVSFEQLTHRLSEEADVPVIKFVLGETVKSNVSQLLNAANITIPRLFPDLVGIASKIQYR